MQGAFGMCATHGDSSLPGKAITMHMCWARMHCLQTKIPKKGYPMACTWINRHLLYNYLRARVWGAWPDPKLDSTFGGSMFRPWCWIVSCHSIYLWTFSVMCRMPGYYLHKHHSDIYGMTAFSTYMKGKPYTLCPNWWRQSFLWVHCFVMLYKHTITSWLLSNLFHKYMSGHNC